MQHEPFFKIVCLACSENSLRRNDYEDASWRRVKVLPFETKFPPEKSTRKTHSFLRKRDIRKQKKIKRGKRRHRS